MEFLKNKRGLRMKCSFVGSASVVYVYTLFPSIWRYGTPIMSLFLYTVFSGC